MAASTGGSGAFDRGGGRQPKRQARTMLDRGQLRAAFERFGERVHHAHLPRDAQRLAQALVYADNVSLSSSHRAEAGEQEDGALWPGILLRIGQAGLQKAARRRQLTQAHADASECCRSNLRAFESQL
jgi:hypothetical protein